MDQQPPRQQEELNHHHYLEQHLPSNKINLYLDPLLNLQLHLEKVNLSLEQVYLDKIQFHPSDQPMSLEVPKVRTSLEVLKQQPNLHKTKNDNITNNKCIRKLSSIK